MWRDSPLPRGTFVQIERNTQPVLFFVDGIWFQQSDHGWVEAPPSGLKYKRQPKRRARKVILNDKTKFAWNHGFNPDVRYMAGPRVPLPGPDQIAAVKRRREEERKREEKRKGKEVRSINESVQGSLEQSPNVNPDLTFGFVNISVFCRNLKRKERQEIDETNWNHKCTGRDPNGKRKRRGYQNKKQNQNQF